MKSLKTELQRIQASPEQSEQQFDYRQILTEKEIEQHLSYYMEREKKHFAYRMADSGLNPNRIAQKMAEKQWGISDEERERILTEAAKRKVWHLEDEQAKEKRHQQYEEQKRLEASKWTAAAIRELIEQHYIGKHGNFINNPSQSKYISALSYFLSNDLRFETELNFSFQKGLLITGDSGVGKTETLKAVKNNPIKPLQIVSTVWVTQVIKTSGDIVLPDDKIVVLDDVGCEPIPIKHYGTDIRWFADLIESRYIGQTDYSNLIITTNLDGDQIEQLYGYRIRSRVRQMFNIISVVGEDIRK
jgi:DNA replication protein DnaC